MRSRSWAWKNSARLRERLAGDQHSECGGIAVCAGTALDQRLNQRGAGVVAVYLHDRDAGALQRDGQAHAVAAGAFHSGELNRSQATGPSH